MNKVKKTTIKDLPATKGDLDNVEKNIRASVKQDLDNVEKNIRANTKLDFDEFRLEINEKINLLPTKDEFFGKMDEVISELKTTREEQTVMEGELVDHEDRITVLERKTGVKTI